MSHEYKVGDYVRILPRVGSAGEYKFSFTDEMSQYAGQTLKIRSIEKFSYGHIDQYPDDGNRYRLEGNGYNWASSMFESADVIGTKVPKLKVGDKVIVLPRKDDPGLYTHLYVNSMLKYIGCKAVITECIETAHSKTLDDGFSYHIDVDGGLWWWSSNALELLATEQSVKASEDTTETNKTAKPFASKSETTEEILKVLEVRIEDDDQRYELNFNI